jgi:hypothetical protein
MDKSNLELFKQAISDGLSKKFDSVVNSYTDEIVCSEQHNFAMRTMVYGKADAKRTWSPKMKRVVAILIAAALLLTSCGIIFRNEIREVFEEFFVRLTYSGDGTGNDTIEEVYELTYLPEGYKLEKENIYDLCVTYTFADKNNNVIVFEQRVWDKSEFTVDSESGYSQMKEIEEYDVYYRLTDKYHNYIWNDGKYAMSIKSKTELSTEQIVQLIDGIKVK